MRLRFGAQARPLGGGGHARQQGLRLHTRQTACIGAAQAGRAQQLARHAVDVVALQFASQCGDVTGLAELAPHRVVEPLVELRQAHRVLRRLVLAIEQAHGNAIAHQLTQHASLQLDDLRGEREVGGQCPVTTQRRFATLEVVDRELALQFGRQAEAVGRQESAGQQIERAALFGRGQWRERVASAAGVVTHRAHATDLACEYGGRTAHVAQRIAHRAAQHRVVLTVGQHARGLAFEQVAGDGDALLREGDDVGAQVELQRLGVDAEEAVLVRTEGEFGLGAARSDLRDRGRFLGRRDRTVGVLDRPVVVGAERRTERRGLPVERHAGRGQVDRGVLHHRAGDAMGGGEGRVGELLLGVDA